MTCVTFLHDARTLVSGGEPASQPAAGALWESKEETATEQGQSGLAQRARGGGRCVGNRRPPPRPPGPALSTSPRCAARAGVDGCVKFWDARHTAQPASVVCQQETMASLYTVPAPCLSQKLHGVVWMALNPQGARAVPQRGGSRCP